MCVGLVWFEGRCVYICLLIEIEGCVLGVGLVNFIRGWGLFSKFVRRD